MEKDLVKEVEALTAEIEKTHRYSMSKIYGLYNRVFGTNERPQSCASCLIRKVRELRVWGETKKSEADKGNVKISLAKENKAKRGRKRKEEAQ